MEFTSIKTQIGTLYLAASENGLRSLGWKRPKRVLDANNSTLAKKHLESAKKQLELYFKGELKNFDLKLDPQGTDFQKKVWHQLSQLSYGKTVSYKDLAEKVGSPKAFRAVGTANANNPLCIIVPCHRVIAANGQLGGYSGQGGLRTKKSLLQLEAQA